MMNDTPPEVDARVHALFMQRPCSDRVRMACDMFDLARALMVAEIRSRHPDLTETDLRVRIFERLYAEDFAPADRARIVARLRDRERDASRNPH